MASRRIQLPVKRATLEGVHVFNYSYRQLKPIECQLRVNNIVSGNMTNCELQICWHLLRTYFLTYLGNLLDLIAWDQAPQKMKKSANEANRTVVWGGESTALSPSPVHRSVSRRSPIFLLFHPVFCLFSPLQGLVPGYWPNNIGVSCLLEDGTRKRKCSLKYHTLLSKRRYSGTPI